MEKFAESLGAGIACQMYNISPEELRQINDYNEVFEEENNTTIVYKQAAAKLADFLHDFGTPYGAAEHHMRLISKQATWIPEYTEAVDTALSVFSEDAMRKYAGITGAGRGAKGFSNLVLGSGKVGLGLAGLLGAAGGGVTWLANRHIHEDVQEVEELNAQMIEYENNARRIEKILKNKYNYDPKSGRQNPRKND